MLQEEERPAALSASSPNTTAFAPIGHRLYWYFMGLAGTLLLTLSPVTLSLLALDCWFFGFLLCAGALVGGSTHLSAATGDPTINLWEKLKAYSSKYKFVSACFIWGTLMANPLLTFLAGCVGLFLQTTYPEEVKKIEDKAILYLNKFYQLIKYENRQRWLPNLKLLIQQNPGRTLSGFIGLLSGLGLGWFMLGEVYPSLFVATGGLFSGFTIGGQALASLFTGGFIPAIFLTAIGALLNGIILATPLVPICAISILANYHAWELTRKLVATCFTSTLQFLATTQRGIMFVGNKLNRARQNFTRGVIAICINFTLQLSIASQRIVTFLSNAVNMLKQNFTNFTANIRTLFARICNIFRRTQSQTRPLSGSNYELTLKAGAYKKTSSFLDTNLPSTAAATTCNSVDSHTSTFLIQAVTIKIAKGSTPSKEGSTRINAGFASEELVFHPESTEILPEKLDFLPEPC